MRAVPTLAGNLSPALMPNVQKPQLVGAGLISASSAKVRNRLAQLCPRNTTFVSALCCIADDQALQGRIRPF